ncbi:unnamed protein product [Trichobilharzia regenti]|nr:unnamed protein product [Trichobilharzia regenti]
MDVVHKIVQDVDKQPATSNDLGFVCSEYQTLYFQHLDNVVEWKTHQNSLDLYENTNNQFIQSNFTSTDNLNNARQLNK